jgi:hypothetical protein
MNRFICCIGFLLSVSVTFAQKVYFIYFETESQQPFFARINEKTYTSSAAGFLILSNLKDSSYTIKIGFPQNKWPEQQFSIPIRSKDHGFLLKNFGEKGWGLFDLQTLSIQMSQATNDKAGSIKRGGVSAFTEILSKAANDPSLLEESPPAIAKNEKKPVVVQQAPKDASTQKEQPAANSIAVAQTKKEDSPPEVAKSPEDKKSAPLTVEQQKQPDTALAKNANKSSTASGTAAQPAKNEIVTTQKEQPAANAIVVTQTKKEDPPVDMATATENNKSAAIAVEQQKKSDTALVKNANTTSTASVTAAQPAKNENVTTKKEPAENATVVTQTKKEDPPVEMTKATDDKKSAPIIVEQQKKSDTALVKNTNSSGTTTAGERPQNNVPVTAKVGGVTKTESPEKYKTSVVTKKSESSTTDGFGLVFIDQFSNGQRDTIAIMIPNPKDAVAKNKEQPSQPKKFLDIGNEERGVTSQVSPSTNKACPLVASDKDFFNLRKKMAAQRTDEQMVNESKRTFKSKCFTTEQIKNLGNLFLNEAGKFQFYEAAYPFSSDQGNFVALQSEFKDKYFIYRFKKLVNLN